MNHRIHIASALILIFAHAPLSHADCSQARELQSRFEQLTDEFRSYAPSTTGSAAYRLCAEEALEAQGIAIASIVSELQQHERETNENYADASHDLCGEPFSESDEMEFGPDFRSICNGTAPSAHLGRLILPAQEHVRIPVAETQTALWNRSLDTLATRIESRDHGLILTSTDPVAHCSVTGTRLERTPWSSRSCTPRSRSTTWRRTGIGAFSPTTTTTPGGCYTTARGHYMAERPRHTMSACVPAVDTSRLNANSTYIFRLFNASYAMTLTHDFCSGAAAADARATYGADQAAAFVRQFESTRDSIEGAVAYLCR